MATLISATPLPVRRPVVDGTIGKLLLEAGKIALRDIDRIVLEQKENGLRFGEAALRLGLVQEDDVLRALARQFEYPCVIASDSSLSLDLVAAYRPQSPSVEALRTLRSRLMLRWFSGSRKQLAFVGTGADEGCSVLVANLAILFSQLGERTLVVDADLRNPALHRLFGLDNRRGLSGFLAGRHPLDEVVTRIDTFVDLSAVCAGATPPNPQELLNRPAFPEFLEETAQQYDVTLVNAAPLLLCADAQPVTARTGGCVVVARRHLTRLADLQAVREHLSATGAEILGVVLSS